MKLLNSSQKDFAIIYLIIAVIGVVAKVTNATFATLNFMDRIGHKDGQTVITPPKPVTDETTEDLEAKKRELEDKLKSKEEEKNRKLKEQIAALQQQIDELDKKPIYIPPPKTSNWKSSCSSPFEHGLVWFLFPLISFPNLLENIHIFVVVLKWFLTRFDSLDRIIFLLMLLLI